MSSPWKNKKSYDFGRRTVYIIKAKPSDPVRWYTELHKDGRYIVSRGSNATLELLAVIETLLKGDR